MITPDHAFDICRCAVAEAEIFHGAREDRREARQEQLLADAPDMQDEAEANLLANESFANEVFSTCPMAMVRLMLAGAKRQDLLPGDYVYTQAIRDSGNVRIEIKSWLESEKVRLVEEWIQEEMG